ncbi:MAG: DNA-binding protein [Mesorhizobium sp.]|nr:helix-turn-helix domain-containing protein [Mesorhizobium sp.]RWE53396.1 MAG: DNA-binding protein [Mesorhizobium sp.]
MLRTEHVAKITGLSASTLTKLRLTGGGPRYIKLGRTVVYDPDDIEAWLRANRRISTSAAPPSDGSATRSLNGAQR